MAKKIRPSLLVGICVDPLGSVKEEVAHIRDCFKTYLTEYRVKFIQFSGIHEVESQPVDVFVVDYGGMCVGGMSDMEHSMHNFMSKIIEDRPTMLTVFWSSFNSDAYKSYMGDELKGIGDHVIFNRLDGDQMQEIANRVSKYVRERV